MAGNPRKVAVVTGTRAEYGLLYWLLREMQSDVDVELQIIVTGMHLSPEFGSTLQVIATDGFDVAAKVEMLLSSDTAVGVTKSIGMGVIGFADALERLQPDIMVVLGDRFEILAATQAAMIAKIPIAHIHGGERTEGVLDESIRHAITKMSQLHFVAAEPYAKRVVQLGEHPDRVFSFGSPGLDHVFRTELLSREELEASLGFELGDSTFLVTYHPLTLNPSASTRGFKSLVRTLTRYSNARVIFTKPNADEGSREIVELIEEYVEKNRERAACFTSLGSQRYLSLAAQADLVIGNSSSGLIEVPFLKTATVNIGDRQKGRLRASSVVDSTDTYAGILAALQTALSKPFQENLANLDSPYQTGDASLHIKECLKNVSLNDLVTKQFYDLQSA